MSIARHFLTTLSGMRYQLAGSRDFRLDLLRGFCVFAMVVDHVGGVSWLYAITGGNRWAVSAGEGFVFLSGLVAGLVYSRKMLRSGFRSAALGLLRRARTLYIITVGMTLLFAALESWTNLQLWVDRSSGLGADSWAEVITGTLTLHYAYHGTDILALYTLLLLVSPLLLLALRAGQTRWVLLVSWGIWAGHALLPDQFQLWPIRNSLYFPLAAWQVLFVTGLVVGYARAAADHQGRYTWRDAVSNALPWITVGLGLLIGVAWLRWVNPGEILPASSFRLTGLENEPLAIGIWDKVSLGPGRIIAFTIAMASFYVLTTVVWKPLNHALGWLLIPMGAGALTAYAVHLFIIVAGYNLHFWGFDDPGLIARNSVGQLILVLIIWAVVQLPSVMSDTRLAFRQAVSRHSVSVSRLLPARYHRHFSRSLLGCASATLMMLFMGGSTARSASIISSEFDESEILAEGIVAPVITGLPGLVSPAAHSVAVPAPLASTPLGRDLAVPGEELAIPGLTLALEGPRTLILHSGQIWPRAFYSSTLERVMPYYVYLPPGYGQDEQRYPVLYMLHGYYGSFQEWAEIGIQQVADDLIASGQIAPMIIVMPEGEQSYYINHGTDGPQWADYITGDVVSMIDSTYRTIPAPDARAIGGLSMGGTGALQLSFLHPDVFGIVGAHSPTLQWHRPRDKFAFADDALFRATNPLELAQELQGLDRLNIWIDVGDDDWNWFTVDELHQELANEDVPHEFNFFEGGHEPDYWIRNQWDYLLFYDRAFGPARFAAR